MSAPFLSADDLAEMQALDESNMPDELRLQAGTTHTDSLDHTYSDPSDFTNTVTVACRWKQLTGRDLEVARALAPTAQGEVACPIGTPVAIFQRFQIYDQGGALVLTARVLRDSGGSNATSVRFYYEQVTGTS